MKKITKLTEEQEARLPEIAKEWIDHGLSIKTDRAKAESLVAAIYKAGDLEPPKDIIWCESPYEGYKLCKEMLDGDERPLPCYGSHDAHWLAFYSAFLEFGIEECAKLTPLMEMAKCSGWFFPMDEACILTPNPKSLNLDDRGRLHCLDSKAIEYEDGWGLYYVHGVAVPEKVVEAPETLTTDEIEAEQNAEVRRVMIERFGMERFLSESGAEEIHKDKWGTLFRKELEGDEPIVTVKVRNSTPEPDGTVKDYFLRVPSTITTAHEAVAWTFSVDKEEYNPVVET